MLKPSALAVLLIGSVIGVPCPKQRSTVPDGALTSLTKLIIGGNIDQAQEAARVNPPLFDVLSYAHYLTVNDEYNSNIFFWYFPVVSADPNAPLLIWLQGGPGTSSLLGLFTEHGPVSIDSNLNTVPRTLAWNKKYNMLYFDNPVGTGFSYTDDEKGYANNMDDVGSNLYAALIQFLALFPDLQKKQLFLTGESYAGKYIPAFAHYIHTNNPNATLKVNLSGLAIGNGFTDPVYLFDFSERFFYIGLVDERGRTELAEKEKDVKDYIARGEWINATFAAGSILMQYPPLLPYPNLIYNLTGFRNIYNYLYQDEPVRYWIDYVKQPKIKNCLHVYDREYSLGELVKVHFEEEMLKSAKPWLEELLGFYRVLIYTGQLDIVVPPKQVHDYTSTLVFPGMYEYQSSHRSKWMVGKFIGGYVKTGGLLTDLVVRDSGHMVPQDQPELAWDLIHRFVNNITFSDLP